MPVVSDIDKAVPFSFWLVFPRHMQCFFSFQFQPYVLGVFLEDSIQPGFNLLLLDALVFNRAQRYGHF